MKEFDRLYAIGKWFLKPEDKEKIEDALLDRQIGNTGTPEQRKVIREAMRMLPGSKLVK